MKRVAHPKMLMWIRNCLTPCSSALALTISNPRLFTSGVAGDWTYGANLNLTLRTGKNDRDYRLGNVYQAGIWTRYALTDWIQPSFRIDGVVWDEISGEDEDLTH